MKFGKLEDISGVDFSIPLEDERSSELLNRGKEEAAPFQAFVGCPVWGNKDWIGKIYPKGTKATDFLHHYSRQFNTIEFNTTHYRIPTREMVAKWKQKAGEGFVFCPKLPQELSHRKRLINCEERLQLFCDNVTLFAEKLGCIFIQLAPNFSPDSLPNIQKFLNTFPNYLPLAIEFRHEAWFRNGQLIPELRSVLEDHNVAALITDVSGRRDVAHASLTNRTAMIRFVGNQLHPSDYTRIDAWIERIEQWVLKGLETLYFFVHEPDDTDAPDIGMYVIERLNEKFDLDLKIPGLPQNINPQTSLF